MAIRAMIGKVDRRGNGQAIYLGHDGCPDQAGDNAAATLLGRGAHRPAHPSGRYVTWLKPTPEASVTYFRRLRLRPGKSASLTDVPGRNRGVLRPNIGTSGSRMAVRLDARRLAGLARQCRARRPNVITH